MHGRQALDSLVLCIVNIFQELLLGLHLSLQIVGSCCESAEFIDAFLILSRHLDSDIILAL